MMWWLIVGLFLSIVLIKAIMNVFRYFATRYYYSKFKQDPSSMARYSEPVGNLFYHANTERVVTRSDRLDSHKIVAQEPVSRNLSNPSNRTVAIDTFENTIGVYSYRIRESFYPTFWIFLPIAILSDNGIEPKPVLKVLISVLYWIFTSIAAYLLDKFLDAHFPEELLRAIESIAR